MSRSVIFGTLAVAAAVVLPAASPAAFAQQPDNDAITVTAPHAKKVGRSATGAPIMEMTAQAVVHTDDLNLRSRSGQYLLHARVSDAADQACDLLDAAFPTGPTERYSPRMCRGDAIRRAQDQVELAIASAR